MKIFKKSLAIVLCFVMVFGAGPLAGFVGIELPDISSFFSKKAEAATEYTSGYYKYSVSGGNAYITDVTVNFPTGAVTIPSTLDGYPVKAIDTEAFYYCSRLTSITIPDGVTSIGSSAFYNCDRLTSITIPDSVSYIGDSAFRGCKSLTNITIPDRVTTINDNVFCSCEILTNVTIPDGVRSIGDSAFEACAKLKYITIPYSVTSIGDAAFSTAGIATAYYPGTPDEWDRINIGAYNYSLTDSVLFESNSSRPYYSMGTCGENLTYVLYSDGEFEITGTGNMTDYTSYSDMPWYKKRSKITSVTLSEGVTSVGSYAFCGCEKPTNITIPNSVTNIGDYAFQNCSTITATYYAGTPEEWNEIGIGTNNTYLTGNIIFESDSEKPYYATGVCGENLTWKFCTDGELVIIGTGNMTDYTSYSGMPWYNERSKITSVSLPDGLTSVGSYAFYGCTGLTSITIPDSVTSIGDEAFYNCTGLTSVYYIGDIAGWCEIEFVNYYSNPMYYADNLYINGTLVSGDLIIPGSVASIGNSAFYNCTGLTSVTIPDSVKSIGDYAFYDCTGLTSVTIPDSVKSIGDYAFYDCDGLTSIAIPESVTSIGSYAFQYCSSLENVTINGAASIGSSAFRYCTSLEKVTLGNSVTSIGSCAFDGCTSLASITIPNSVTTIGSYAFDDCTSLEDITIPDSVTSIGSYAFQYCSRLESATIGNGVTSIGNYAFRYCSSLASVTIGNGVTSIGSDAFYNCKSLENITIPDSVTSIGYGAFEGCDSLESITLPFVGASRDATTSAAVLGYVFGYKTESFSKKYFYSYDAPRPGFINSGYGSDGGAIWQYTYCEYDRYYNNYYYYDFYVYYYYIPSTLKKVTITDAKTIQTSAFNGCKNISEISINNEVASIGSYAFNNCTGLKTVYYDGTFKEWNNITIGSANTQLKNAEKYSIYFATFNAAGGTFSDGSNRQKFRMKISENYVSCEEPTKEGYVFVGWSPKVPNEIPKENVKFYAQWKKVNAVEHEHETKIYNAITPTCTADGHTGYIYCETCNEIIDYGEAIPAYGHDFDVQVTVEPTCTEKGEGIYTCKYCDYSETGEVAAKGHSYEGKVTLEPTCTEKGTKTFTCSACSVSYTEDIAATGNHSYKGEITTEPGCVEKGVETFTCSMCGDVYTEEVDAKGHSYDIGVVTIQPTCTEKGTKTFTCSTCGDYYTEEIAAKGHKYVGSITTQPTCTQTGVMTNTCSNCGDSYTEELDKKPHSYSITVESVPTKTENGTIKYTCSGCGDSYTKTTNSKLETASVKIDTYSEDIFVCYGDKLILTATGTDLPENAKLVWYTDETKKAEGNKLEIASVGDLSKVTVKAVDSNGNVITANHTAVEDSANIGVIYPSIKNNLNYGITNSQVHILLDNENLSGDIIIPSMVDGYPVTQIGKMAFYNNTKITSVRIPEGVTSIGPNAFCGCTNLTEIYLPESLKKIDDYAFRETAISSIFLSRNITSIGSGVFNGCASLKKVIIPDGITKLNTYLFSDCTSLETVVIPKSVTRIEGSVFNNCPDLYSIYYLGTEAEWNSVSIGLSMSSDYDESLMEYNETRTIREGNGGAYCGFFDGFRISGYNESYEDSYQKAINISSVLLRPGYEFDDWTSYTDNNKNTIVYAMWIPKHDHEVTVLNRTYPGCEEGHTGYVYCETCNDIIDYGSVIPSNGHRYNSGVVTTKATCTKNGIKTFTCSACGDVYTEDIVALGHSYTGVVTKEPTCAEKGIKTFTCSACGDTYTEDIEVLGHTYSSSITKVPTCTEEGEMTYTCSVCNDSYTKPINKRTHTYSGTTVTKEPTCTEDGEESYYCSVCKGTYTNKISAIGHNYSSVVTAEPNCTQAGTRTFTCANCNDVYTEKIETLGHIEVVDKAVAPSCTQSGLTQGLHCERCNNALIKQEVVPATGHQNYGEWQIVQNSTCTSEGEKYRVCADCGHTEYSNIELADHTWNIEYTVDKAATCTADGSKSIHCSKCSATKDSTVIPATGHTEAISKGIEPTCSATGKTEGKYCSVCNEVLVKQETIPAKAHTEVVDNAVAPTYEKTGLTEGKHCSVCGKVTVAQKTVAKLAAPTLKIRNNNGSTTLDYGNSIKLTAVTSNLPEGAKIFWYVDGSKAGEGETLTINEPKNSVTVNVKLVDASGNAIVISGSEIGDKEEIKVNNGFFQKIIAFFKRIFGMLKTVEQSIKYL